MTFKKGQSGNPSGVSKETKRILRKIKIAMDKAIDGLGSASDNGTTEMAKLITEALRKDVVGTLRSLSVYMPKDVNIDVTRHEEPSKLTDEELADIIADRARTRRDQEKQIEGEIVDNEAESG